MATPNYEINYEDPLFKENETAKQDALTENDNLYDGMIKESDQFYQAQIDAANAYAAQQSAIQNQMTDFAIQEINQHKDQTTKDYKKEQSGAYVDWQKQSNQYGANAEQQAASGLTNSGFAESSQVSMYNTYQNRVAAAREVYNQAITNYNNQITQARLQNSAALAEIAYNALSKGLELSLQGFQYKNQLVSEQANKKAQIESTYHGYYQDILAQMNTENALAEEVRQYDENIALQKERDAEAKRQWEKEIEITKARDAEAKRQWEAEQAYKKERDKVADSQWQKEYNLVASKNTGSSGGSSGGSITKSSGSSSSGSSSRSSGYVSVADLNRSTNGSGKSTNTTQGGRTHSGGSSRTYAVNTAYYQGAKNSDAKKYGTFSNGYQPKGISGHGTLSKTGKTVQLSTQTLSGQKQTVVQNVWKAKDGTKWYWEGRQNKYIQIK